MTLKTKEWQPAECFTTLGTHGIHRGFTLPVSAKILRVVAEEIFLSLSTLYNSCMKKVSGHVTGEKETGHQSIKRGQELQG